MSSDSFIGILSHDDSWTFTDVSKNRSAFIFSATQSTKSPFCLTCHKTRIFSNTAVRTSNLKIYWRPDHWKRNTMLELEA
jgi:hypothetical protein